MYAEIREAQKFACDLFTPLLSNVIHLFNCVSGGPARVPGHTRPLPARYLRGHGRRPHPKGENQCTALRPNVLLNLVYNFLTSGYNNFFLLLQASYVWYLFFAIAAHKFVISFCIGIQFVSSGLRPLFIVLYQVRAIYYYTVADKQGLESRS